MRQRPRRDRRRRRLASRRDRHRRRPAEGKAASAGNRHRGRRGRRGQGIGPITADLYNEVEGDFLAQANAVLDKAAATMGEVEAGVGKAVLEGGVADATKHYSEPGDLIVMTSDGRSGFRRMLLGRVAQKIIHDRIAPVVLVPATDELGAGS